MYSAYWSAECIPRTYWHFAALEHTFRTPKLSLVKVLNSCKTTIFSAMKKKTYVFLRKKCNFVAGVGVCIHTASLHRSNYPVLTIARSRAHSNYDA
jgi:hypothetical protein